MKKILLASGLVLILSASSAFAWHGGGYRHGGSPHHKEYRNYSAPQAPQESAPGYYDHNGWHDGGGSAPGYYDHGGGHEQAADSLEIHKREMQDPRHRQ